MLRIHFTDRDLARVRVAAAPDPLWETVLAMQKLTLDGIPAFARWRRRVREGLRERDTRTAVRFLQTIAPLGAVLPGLPHPRRVRGRAEGGAGGAPRDSRRIASDAKSG